MVPSWPPVVIQPSKPRGPRERHAHRQHPVAQCLRFFHSDVESFFGIIVTAIGRQHSALGPSDAAPGSDLKPDRMVAPNIQRRRDAAREQAFQRVYLGVSQLQPPTLDFLLSPPL